MDEMRGIASRLTWFLIIAVVVAYAGSTALGSIVSKHESGVGEPIIIRDQLRANEHALSGMVMVPTPCDELVVHTEALSQTTYALLFKTWREPSVDCGGGATPRAFHTVLFAPAAGVTFIATLNDRDLPVAVIPITAGGH
jgi:hypothetical protein